MQVLAQQLDLTHLLETQKEQIQPYFDQLDLAAVTVVFEACKACKGILYFCGLGKSGLIAEKIALTLSSTGTRASFLSAVNAMHGDLGILAPDDIVLFVSKSGQSDELLQVLPFVKRRGCKTISVTCLQNSRLQAGCDIHLHLPMGAELCPFDLAPTTSAAVQLLFGDLLTVALMRERGFSLMAYGLNHPAGRIGKRIALRVRDIMKTGAAIPLAHPSTSLVEALPTLSDKRCGCLLIAEKGQLIGIFTDGDLRRALQKRGPEALSEPLLSLMTLNPQAIHPDALAFDAMQEMEREPNRRIMMLPVTENGHICGLILMHDIIQAGL